MRKFKEDSPITAALLEPIAGECDGADETVHRLSLAVSAKRIADALERLADNCEAQAVLDSLKKAGVI